MPLNRIASERSNYFLKADMEQRSVEQNAERDHTRDEKSETVKIRHFDIAIYF